jgi:hypothetical protein
MEPSSLIAFLLIGAFVGGFLFDQVGVSAGQRAGWFPDHRRRRRGRAALYRRPVQEG